MRETPSPDTLALLALALITVTSVPAYASAALLSQIVQVIGDNTWPTVVLLLGLALIQTLGPKR